MKGCAVSFVFYIILIFVVGCGEGLKTDYTTDTGPSVTDEDTIDSGSTDTKPDGDTEPSDNLDSDNPDTTQENPDTDDADTTPDSGDSQSDADQDSDPDATDNDADTTSDNPDSDDTDSELTTEPSEPTEEPKPDEDEIVVIEPTDDATCSEIGGIWNSGKCTKSVSCTGLPENAVWNKASGIRQTWNGTEWVPSATGSYSATSSTSECVFKCKTNYEWNTETSTCDGATRQTICPSKPANTVWNDNDADGTFTQTWNGASWEPATYNSTYNKTAGTCTYTCTVGYIWNGSVCETAPTQSANCTGLPANAEWNTVSSITQTYDGTSWYPSTTGVYNTTASTMQCRFKCKTNYNWNSSTSKCVAATQTASCAGLPTGAVWNTASSITQTWSGSEWLPTTTGSYNTTSSTSECRYKCGTNYTWKNSQCVADTKDGTCSSKPANTVWNDNDRNGKFTQTWSGTSWSPASYASTYNKTAGICTYTCIAGYIWNGSSCEVAPTQSANCTGLPANAQWNTASSITQTYDGSSWYPSTAGVYNTTSSTSECRYKCKEHYSWKNSQCVADTQTASCTGLPANASWNTASSITQTWSGSAWLPTTTGSYSTTSSTTQCRFKCNTNYNWNSSTSKCDAATQQVTCTGLPSNAQWNTASSITQTWNGSSWQPTTTGSFNNTASTSECRYKCKTNYNWNSSTSTCDAATQQANCSSKPANTVWNDNGANGKFSQTWNGASWNPASYTSTYNITAGTCRYKCDTNYNWNSSTSTCDAATQQANCSSKPANTVWNDNGANGKFTQTWNGSAWNPANYTSTYNTTAGTCRFKCNTNYNWNSSTSKCEAATQPATCTGLPANASWNTVSSITQTWNGSSWQPTTIGSYNETSSTTECRFGCNMNYNWNSSTSTCDAATQNGTCSSKPANTDWNDNGRNGKFTQTWDGSAWEPASYDSSYNTTAGTCRYKCTDNYHYENGQCIFNTKSNVACTGLPANTQWNTVSTITQTWNGSSYQPTNVGSYNETASSTECRYKCAEGYHRENGQCVSNTKNNVECIGLPANAQWNTASTISQTWNGSSWQPTTTGSYNTAASTSQCYYKCKDGYHTENGGVSCISNTKTSSCTGLIPHAQWNTASTITQTWNGSSWVPATSGSYSETASTSECRYKCDSTHYWYNSECTNPCDYEPCEDVTNSQHICTATSWQDYSCDCNDGYVWNNALCILTLGKICTNQSKCYNASSSITCPASSSANFYGQDSQYINKCTEQNFTVKTVSEEEISVDNNTGLEWLKTIPSTNHTWDEAKTYCEDLTYGGYSDWRLPNPQEILTIVAGENAKGRKACVSSSNAVPLNSNQFLWTSQEFNNSNGYKLDAGEIDYTTKTESTLTCCVRGDEMPKGIFLETTVNGAVVVTDSTTGHIWQKNYATNKTWQAALKYCEDSTYAGYTDWRLPNKNELASLLNYDKTTSPRSDFPDMPGQGFWSSTTYDKTEMKCYNIHSCTTTHDYSYAWHVYFNGLGTVSFNNKGNGYDYVRCVRN